MKPTHLTLSLTVAGPVAVHSTASSSFGLDTAVARLPAGPNKDKPYLPFSLIKGKLRDAWLELKAVEDKAVEDKVVEDKQFSIEDCIRLFGKGGMEKHRTQEGTQAKSNDESLFAGRLLLDDLVAKTPVSPGKPSRFATAVEEKTGAAKHQTLRVTETPFPTGTEVLFEGEGWIYLPEKDASRLVPLLGKALAWLAQIGAFRSIGFGQVLKASLTVGDPPPDVTEFDNAPEALELELRPSGPICVTAHHVGDNFFESDDLIPGNMIAGAIMETRKTLGITDAPPGFDQVRFGHARPCRPDGNPTLAPPLSLAATSAGICDVAHYRNTLLLRDKNHAWAAPAFMTDWKPDVSKKLANAYQPVRPVHETRVRTAIHDGTRTADRGEGERDGKLFALDVVHPYDAADPEVITELIWKARIDLSQVDPAQRKACADALASDLCRLGFVSKTKAVCEGRLKAVEPIPVPECKEGDTIALVLQTPAQLADPRFQNIQGVPKDGPISAADMLKCYRAAFADAHLDKNQALQLSHVFANQFLAGGDTLAHRFGKTARYNPWLLTSPGSVFVFTVKDAEKAGPLIGEWLNRGLPLPGWAVVPFGDDWKSNPYIPQNGFGAVARHAFHHPTPEHKSDLGTVLT